MNNLTIDQEMEIIEKRKNGLKIKDIIVEYGISGKTQFYRIINRNGRKKIIPNKKYNCNDDFFEVINTEKKAYWLGFFFADGFVRKRKSSGIIEIKIASKDKSHLIEFLADIDSNFCIKDKKVEKIYKGELKTYYTSAVYIYSNKMYDDLVDKGCVNCKSLILEPPLYLPEELVSHFIRGYFDGDGSITNYISRKRIETKIKILGTLKFLQWINIQLSLNGISIRNIDKQTEQIFRIQYNTKDVQSIFNYVYRNSTLFLERKKEKFINI